MAQMGSGGFVNFADAQASLITKWELDIAITIEDISSFDDESNAKTKFELEYQGTGRITAWTDAAAMPDISNIQDETDTGAVCSLILTGGSDGTAKYTISNALLKSIQLGVKRGALQSYTAVFRSIGAIA